jgi:serine/threonine protein kinase
LLCRQNEAKINIVQKVSNVANMDRGPQLGQRIGAYTLKRRLGAGGFASVWMGEDPAGQCVAVKVLHPRHCLRKHRKGPSVAERFLDEARMLTGLNIPGVVRVLSIIDERDDGIIAYTMELLFGSDLSGVFLELDGITIIEIFAVVCETLARLHDEKIIHRDIKSANIFVSVPDSDNNRSIKLIDFGVAKVLQAKSLMESTATGVIVGTIQTLAPECIGRLNGDDVDLTWSVDQWGIGVALYHCLSGRLPFNSHAVLQLVTDIQSKPTPPLILRSSVELARVQDDVESVIERCLEKDPDDRYPCMIAVAEAFRGIISKHEKRMGRSERKSTRGDSQSVVTIPPSSGIRTDPSAMPSTHDAVTMMPGTLGQSTDKSPVISSGQLKSHAEAPQPMHDRTELDIDPESVATIVPMAYRANVPQADTPIQSSPPKRQENTPPADDGANPRIGLAPVGNTGVDIGQDPTQQMASAKPNAAPLGSADTVQSIPPSQRAHFADPQLVGKSTHEALERPSGISLEMVLIMVGISIFVSFGLGWFLRGL